MSERRQAVRRAADRDAGGKPPCPKCGSDKSTIPNCGKELFRHVPQGTYPRQRRCRSCRFLWMTMEQNLHA